MEPDKGGGAAVKDSDNEARPGGGGRAAPGHSVGHTFCLKIYQVVDKLKAVWL